METLHRPLPPKLRVPVLIAGIIGTLALLMYLYVKGVSSERLLIVGVLFILFTLGVYFKR